MAGQTAGTHLHGKSWIPIFKNKASEWRSSFLVEYYSDTGFPRIQKMGYKAVRDNRYKYIHYVDLNGMNELYDLKKDPYELHNLISNSDYKHILEKMKKKLNLLLRQSDADSIN
jgi:N-acetylglucosamine-6-sulfatase